MKQTAYDQYPKDKIKNLLAGIPFFNDLAMKDSAQHELLLKHSAILELSGGDVLITKGAVDRHYYFLLKGELAVYADKTVDRKSVPVSRLAQGQVLGAMAVITGLPRTATVALEKGSSDALVFSADTSLFGELSDFSSVSLSTKLALYRNVINNTRFKLEGYKAKNPKHPLTEEYLQLPKFAGEKETLSELQYFSQQAMVMARLLQSWNETQ